MKFLEVIFSLRREAQYFTLKFVNFYRNSKHCFPKGIVHPINCIYMRLMCYLYRGPVASC